MALDLQMILREHDVLFQVALSHRLRVLNKPF